MSTTTDLDVTSTGYDALAPEVRDRWAVEQVQTIRKTVGKDLSIPEFQMGLALAAKYDLDPLLHEIWFAKDKANDRVLIMTGRDGFLTIARRQEIYEGMAHDVVRAKDEFSVEWENGVPSVSHKYKGDHDARGEIKGAWAIAYFKGKKPTYFYAPLKEYLPTNERKLKFSPWGSQLSVMMLKVPQSYVLRIGSGVTGLVGAEEAERALESRPESLIDDEGTEEAYGTELPPNVEAMIARAEALGHPGWAERSAWAMHRDRGQEYLTAKLVQADDDLKALAKKKAAAEEIQDADVVDPDVPIDADGLPESPRTHTMREDGFISSIPSLGEAASEAEDSTRTEQADPGSVPSSEGVRSESPAQDPTNAAPVAGGATPVSIPTASKTSDAKPPAEVDSGTPQPETSTSASHIEYLAAPGKNELLFRHQDCGARWTIALEDEHLPLREQDGVQCPTCKQTLSVRPSAQEEKRVKKLTESAPTQEVSELDRLRAERKAYAELPADGEDEVAEKEQLLNSIDRKIAALEAAGNPNQESMEV